MYYIKEIIKLIQEDSDKHEEYGRTMEITDNGFEVQNCGNGEYWLSICIDYLSDQEIYKKVLSKLGKEIPSFQF